MPNNPGNSSNPNDPKKKPINPAALGNPQIKSADVIQEVEPMGDLQDETLPDENPDSTTQAPHDPSSEPYGAQILRRIHDDHSRLLADYDSLLGPLEHPKVRKLMERKLQNIEKELCDFEALWGSDDIYKGLPPLEDAMDGDPDAMDGEPTEAIQEDELDQVADEGYEDAPMEEGYPEEGDPYGGDDMDTMDDVAVPADSGAELEETPPEEAWEASQADDPLDKAIKSWEQTSSQLKKKLVQTKTNESSADQEGYEVVDRSPLAQNTEGAPHGVRHADKVDRELYAAAQQQTLHDLENGQDKIEMRKPGGDSPVVVNYRRDGRTVSSRGYQNTEQAKKQANKDTASRRRSGAEVSDVSERTQEKQMGKKGSCLTCGKATCICTSKKGFPGTIPDDHPDYQRLAEEHVAKQRAEAEKIGRDTAKQERNATGKEGISQNKGQKDIVRTSETTGGTPGHAAVLGESMLRRSKKPHPKAAARKEQMASGPMTHEAVRKMKEKERRGNGVNPLAAKYTDKSLKDDLGAWDVNELHKVGEIQTFLNDLACEGSSFDDETRMKSYHFHKIMDDMTDGKKSGDAPGPGGEGTTKEERVPQAAPSLHTGGHSGVYEEGNRYDDVYEDDKSIHPHRKMCKDASGFFKKLSQERAFGDPHRQEAQGFYTKLSELLGRGTKATPEEDDGTPEMPLVSRGQPTINIHDHPDSAYNPVNIVRTNAELDANGRTHMEAGIQQRRLDNQQYWGSEDNKSFNVTLDNQELQLSKLQKTLESLSSVLGKY